MTRFAVELHLRRTPPQFPSLSFRDILLVTRLAVELHLRKTPPQFPSLSFWDILLVTRLAVELHLRRTPPQFPSLSFRDILLVTRLAVELHLRRTPTPKPKRYGDLMSSSTYRDPLLLFWDLRRVSRRRNSISIQEVIQGLIVGTALW